MEDTESKENMVKEVLRENVGPQPNGLSQAKKVLNNDSVPRMMLIFA